VRQLISIPAGLAGMHLGKFLFFTTLGAGIWNTVLALIGYAIYKAFPAIDTPQKVADKATEYSHVIGYAILAIVALGLVWMVVKKLKKKPAGQ
jgi:membrane protein DedA with SNARE-associated domain